MLRNKGGYFIRGYFMGNLLISPLCVLRLPSCIQKYCPKTLWRQGDHPTTLFDTGDIQYDVVEAIELSIRFIVTGKRHTL